MSVVIKDYINQKKCIAILAIPMFVFLLISNGVAQDNKQLIRIVEIEIDSIQLKTFYAALKEDIETAVRTEPGVLTLFAFYDKVDPSHITVFEIYSSEAAHKSHQQSPHFLNIERSLKEW